MIKQRNEYVNFNKNKKNQSKHHSCKHFFEYLSLKLAAAFLVRNKNIRLNFGK